MIELAAINPFPLASFVSSEQWIGSDAWHYTKRESTHRNPEALPLPGPMRNHFFSAGELAKPGGFVVSKQLAQSGRECFRMQQTGKADTVPEREPNEHTSVTKS
jgi:hypothetical protein